MTEQIEIKKINPFKLLSSITYKIIQVYIIEIKIRYLKFKLKRLSK